jgi:hypothetical protein
MMKKILSLGVTVLMLVGVVLFGQKAEEPGYPFKVDKDVATAVFAKKTYDEVWGATLKALIALDYETTTLEKDAGIIKAVDIQKPKVIKSESAQIPGAVTTLTVTRRAKSRAIAVRVEAQGAKIAVSWHWDTSEKFTLLPGEANWNHVYSAFYNKIAELLYGKVEKK